LRVDDAAELASILADPALYRYIRGSPPAEEELEARYERQSRGVSPDGRQRWLNWVMRRSAGGSLLGVVQATVSERDGTTAADLAWMVASHAQGIGLATEAALTVVEWLRRVGVVVLRARINPDNAASETVARRIGLIPIPAVEDGETVWQKAPEAPS
jgi:RimJ/RimL family protein N-acetyltransferase